MARILFAVGRMIGGSLKTMRPRTENDGKTPKTDASGNALMVCNFGVAIPKGAEAHWNQTEWGKLMFDIGKAAYPQLHQAAAFAWKVVDGDDERPNKNGTVPKDQVGYAGNWVLWFSQGWLPKQCNIDGSVELQPGAIVPGYYIHVLGEVMSNGAQPPNTPGLYLNPVAVALIGEGDVISVDVDTKSVGFGAAQLPAGARSVTPAVEGFTKPATPPVPPKVVTPSATFMAPPAPPKPPAPVRRMTTAAGGATFEQMIEAGWTEELLREHGMME
jgi:hypothetical protein